MELRSQVTIREKEVLLLLSQGNTYLDTSKNMNVGVSTVRKHVQSILQKLGAKNTTHAVAISVKNGLIDPP